MDEPFAALDEFTRQDLNDDLIRLWRDDGLTVVFVTHSVYESTYLSTRIVVMTPRPGRIAADIAFARRACTAIPPIASRRNSPRTPAASAPPCATG